MYWLIFWCVSFVIVCVCYSLYDVGYICCALLVVGCVLFVVMVLVDCLLKCFVWFPLFGFSFLF